MPMLVAAANTTMDALKKHAPPPHSSHPSFINLAGLVSEAVLEVVFVALPGFLVAYTGMFDASSQKFVAELNTMVFTPCLIFTKLASQLNADKLSDLAVIPFIFVLQTLVSFVCAQASLATPTRCPFRSSSLCQKLSRACTGTRYLATTITRLLLEVSCTC